MNTSLQALLLGLLFFEAFEISWQKGRTTRQYIASLLFVYERHVLLFLAFHPSFYYVIFCMMVLENSSGFLVVIVVLKLLDLLFKLMLCDKLTHHKALGFMEPLVSIDQPFPWPLKLFPLLLYAGLFSLGVA
jgi:hypothetical protein